MAVPKRKTTPSKRGMRRAHDKLDTPTYIEDKDSGELRRPHHIDLKSGMYRGIGGNRLAVRAIAPPPATDHAVGVVLYVRNGREIHVEPGSGEFSRRHSVGLFGLRRRLGLSQHMGARHGRIAQIPVQALHRAAFLVERKKCVGRNLAEPGRQTLRPLARSHIVPQEEHAADAAIGEVIGHDVRTLGIRVVTDKPHQEHAGCAVRRPARGSARDTGKGERGRAGGNDLSAIDRHMYLLSLSRCTIGDTAV